MEPNKLGVVVWMLIDVPDMETTYLERRVNKATPKEGKTLSFFFACVGFEVKTHVSDYIAVDINKGGGQEMLFVVQTLF